MRDLAEQAREMLRERADPAVRESTLRFFKEEVRAYGVKDLT